MNTSSTPLRRRILNGRFAAPLLTLIASSFFLPSSALADCCGGGGGSSALGGKGGMPPTETFAQSSQLRLHVTPGARHQILQIWNTKTGERLGSVSVGGDQSQPAPFGVTAPAMSGDSGVAYTLSDAPDATTGSHGSVQEASGDNATGSGKKKCPNCDPVVESLSVNEPIPTNGDTTAQCKKAGTGSRSNTASGAPDDIASGGSPGYPISPEPPNPTSPPPEYPIGSGPGSTAPAPAPALFDALLGNLQKVKGGVTVSIGTSGDSGSSVSSAPPIIFSARNLGALNSGADRFRRYFTGALFGKYGTTVSPENAFNHYLRTGRELDMIADQDGIRSMVAGEWVINLKREGNLWRLEFISTSSKNDWDIFDPPYFPDPDIQTDLDGYRRVVFRRQQNNSSETIDAPPLIIWSFSTASENGKTVLTVTRSTPYWDGPVSTTRHWQTDDADGRHTFEEDLETGTLTEVIDRDSGADFVRGMITYSGTGNEQTHEGWIMRTGPSYQDQPTSADPNITTVNFGGSGNTVWQWASNGMWEKKSVAPSIDAPTRRVETLRPWGDTTSPQTATPQNAHSTVEEFYTTRSGDVRTTIVSIGGNEVSRTINANSATEESPNSGIMRITDTTLRYPNGLANAPLVSVQQRYSNQIYHPGAGQTCYRQEENGAVEYTAFTAGILHTPEMGDWEFDPMPTGGYLSEYGARRAERVRFLDGGADGRVEKQIDYYDDHGRLRITEQFVVVGGTDYLTEAIRRSYRGTELVKLERRRSVANDWKTQLQVFGTTNEPNYVVVTDETGVETTITYLDPEKFYPLTITRQSLSAVNDLPAIPEQTIEYQYDSARRIKSMMVKQGNTILKQELRTYDDQGRLENVTLNNGVATEYRYADTGGGGEILRKYRHAASVAGPGELAEETVYDWRGALVYRTGSKVIEEHRYETVLGTGSLKVTTAYGSASTPLITEDILIDGAGRQTGEKADVPNGQWRTWVYDVRGRPTGEFLNGQSVRSWSYGSTGVTNETIYPAPDPQRLIVSQRRYITDGGSTWESHVSGTNESQLKIGGFASANEVAVRRYRDHGGAWTTITTIADPDTKSTTENTERPTATDKQVRKFRAGLVVWEKARSTSDAIVYEYDAVGRVVKVHENAEGRITTITYDAFFGQTTSVTIVGSDGKSSWQTSTYYQPNEANPGKLKSHTVDGCATNCTWTPRGELAAVWGSAYPVKYDYDAAGRLWKMHTYRADPGNDPNGWPAGDVTEWSYHAGTSALQSKKDAAGKGPTYEYNPSGDLSKRTWARTISGAPLYTVYTHNGMGELTGIGYSDGTPSVQITRDALGRTTGITDGTGGWAYAYDGWDRLEREVNNSSGNALIYARDGQRRRVGYSYWNQQTASWDTWGGFGYDGATGLLNGVSTPEGWISQSYEAGTNRPNGTVFGAIHSSRGYDKLGRLNSTRTWVVGITGADPELTRAYGYNAAGQRETMTLENNDVWQFSYNGRNEVTGGSKKRNGTALSGQQFGYTYDPIGNRTQSTREGRPISWMSNSLNQYPASYLQFVFADVLGEADPAATVRVNGNIASRNGSYFYGTISLNPADPVKPTWLDLTVREEKSGQPPVETTGKLVARSRYVYCIYDLDGNLTQDERWNYTWDAENRLVKQETRWQGTYAVPGLPIQKLEYKYDAFWRRVEKKVSTWNSQTNSYQQTKLTKFAYDGWNLIAEWEALGSQSSTLNLVRSHYWSLDLGGTLQGAGGVGGLVLTRHHQPNGQTASYVPAYDGTGNILALYDSVTGKRAAEYEYGPFGELLRITGGTVATTNPLRWATKYYDGDTGALYFGKRYYSVPNARWMSRDPLEEEGGVNLYGACANDTVNRFDILGLRRGLFPEYVPEILPEFRPEIIPILRPNRCPEFEETPPRPRPVPPRPLGPGMAWDPYWGPVPEQKPDIPVVPYEDEKPEFRDPQRKKPYDPYWMYRRGQRCIDHHIFTDKNGSDKDSAGAGPWTPLFEKVFAEAGMKLQDPLNLCPMCFNEAIDTRVHKGNHLNRQDKDSLETYHGMVWRELADALAGTKSASEDMKKCILKDLLKKLCERLNTAKDDLRNLVTEDIANNE